jgi:hypothetical protein
MLEERLTSRFNQGLVTDIKHPDLETRVAILRQRCAQEGGGVRLPDDVLLLMSDRIRSNIRDLEGCLVRLLAVGSLTHQEISVELAEDVLRDYVNPEPEHMTPERILTAVREVWHQERRVDRAAPHARRGPAAPGRDVSPASSPVAAEQGSVRFKSQPHDRALQLPEGPAPMHTDSETADGTNGLHFNIGLGVTVLNGDGHGNWEIRQGVVVKSCPDQQSVRGPSCSRWPFRSRGGFQLPPTLLLHYFNIEGQ